MKIFKRGTIFHSPCGGPVRTYRYAIPNVGYGGPFCLCDAHHKEQEIDDPPPAVRYGGCLCEKVSDEAADVCNVRLPDMYDAVIPDRIGGSGVPQGVPYEN